MTSIQPELWVESPGKAVAFYEDAFGATVLHRVGAGDDIVAQLGVGEAAFWVAPTSAAMKRLSPMALDGATSRTLLVVEDPERIVRQALAAGATEVSPVSVEHGWRLGRIVDPFGHEWEIGMPLRAPVELAAPLAPFVDPLPLPRRLLAREHGGRLSVRMRAGTHRFHRDLPASRIWGYDGTVPGPTIEAERSSPVHVEWINELEGTLPVVVTRAPTEADERGVPVQCLPGLSGGTADPDAAALTGFTVVHLHGGLTPAAYDGWTENVFAPGQDAVGYYPMEQRAALLWYHDHVMGVTRFTVYAGLAGLWIVRDEVERALGLPEGPPFEVPLVLQDRNFGQDADGRLTGQLVHKTDAGTMEAFAPFATVNGKVWPVLDVQPATYRFRVLNGSNARTFRLVLLRGDEPEPDRISQIGTDGGLLPAPVAVPPAGLVLASAERADLLVDFSDLAPGVELTLVNTARSPFDGTPFPPERAGRAADLAALLPYPDVMRFRVVEGPAQRRSAPPRLASDVAPPGGTELDGAVRRTIALVEEEREGEVNMLTMRELAEVADAAADEPLLTLLDAEGRTLARLRTVATRFEDAATFFPMLGRYEVWRLLNLTGDTHPVHVHLCPFHVLGRQPIAVTVPDGGIAERTTAATVRLARAPDDELEHAVDDNERGLKDTVRVNPNELVEVAVRFETYSGRYMYHCHILEHEDRDMMRPIVIMPAELGPFMG
jgi:FtsP/CotA-like multicopper oxidase with cupredoxin domain